MSADSSARARVFEQLFFRTSGLGVTFGNVSCFRKLTPEPVPLAVQRFGGKADRIIGVLDIILSENRQIAGSRLSIADIAHFGWLWRRELPLRSNSVVNLPN